MFSQIETCIKGDLQRSFEKKIVGERRTTNVFRDVKNDYLDKDREGKNFRQSRNVSNCRNGTEAGKSSVPTMKGMGGRGTGGAVRCGRETGRGDLGWDAHGSLTEACEEIGNGWCGIVGTFIKVTKRARGSRGGVRD